MRSAVLVLSAVLLTTNNLRAAEEAAPAVEVAPQAASASADNFVKDVSKSVIQILNEKGSQADKQKKLTEMFQNTMDIDWIARFVLGKFWKGMSEKDQQEYMKNYKDYITASYVPVFKDYNGQSLTIKSVKDIGKDSYLVVTDIQSANSDVPYRVEYRIKLTSSGYKIRDIIAEGVSMITTQRSEFATIASSSGVDALNSQLKRKVATLK